MPIEKGSYSAEAIGHVISLSECMVINQSIGLIQILHGHNTIAADLEKGLGMVDSDSSKLLA